jgi:uncharacterized membrane protein (UPF0127 family)
LFDRVNRNTTVAIVASIGALLGIIATVTAVYFYPFIPSFLGVSEVNNNPQELVMGLASPNSSGAGYRQINVTINGIELVADVAETNEQRTKGLSVKDALTEKEAMVFVFDTAQEHSFWMKDMKFPIDIIWLDRNKIVVHVEHNLQPCSFDGFCQTYKPDKDALYVIETVAGFAKNHNIVEGTRFDFS